MMRIRQVRGFTLVEMTVALVVMSLIMLATVTALRTLGASQVALERLTERNDEIRAVSTYVRNAMELAIVASRNGGLSLGGDSRAGGVFETTPNSVTWMTVQRFGEGTGGTYMSRVAREGSNVVLRWQKPTSRGGYRDWNNAPSRTLITGVQEFDVAYRRAFGGPWVRERGDADTPAWLRLRVKANDRFWPDIILQVPK